MSVSELDVNCFSAALLEKPQGPLISITAGKDGRTKVEIERVAIKRVPSGPSRSSVQWAWHDEILQSSVQEGSDVHHTLFHAVPVSESGPGLNQPVL
jgi:hypothetical protein